MSRGSSRASIERRFKDSRVTIRVNKVARKRSAIKFWINTCLNSFVEFFDYFNESRVLDNPADNVIGNGQNLTALTLPPVFWQKPSF